jgi:hypothetical protein
MLDSNRSGIGPYVHWCSGRCQTGAFFGRDETHGPRTVTASLLRCASVQRLLSKKVAVSRLAYRRAEVAHVRRLPFSHHDSTSTAVRLPSRQENACCSVRPPASGSEPYTFRGACAALYAQAQHVIDNSEHRVSSGERGRASSQRRPRRAAAWPATEVSLLVQAHRSGSTIQLGHFSLPARCEP